MGKIKSDDNIVFEKGLDSDDWEERKTINFLIVMF